MKEGATIRVWSAVATALLLCSGLSAQDSSSPSLGDVARQTRREHAEAHMVAHKLTNDEDGPDTTGVWRIQLCTRQPCYEMTITLPKDVKWTRAAAEPRPVLLPLPGVGEDHDRVIQLFAAESLEPNFPNVDIAARTLLKVWFARPEYFGNPARITQNERIFVDNYLGVISHFSVNSGASKFKGISIVTASQNGNYGFACVFREEDAAAATSICDAIVKSARNELLATPPPRYYPPYQPPDDPDP